MFSKQVSFTSQKNHGPLRGVRFAYQHKKKFAPYSKFIESREKKVTTTMNIRDVTRTFLMDTYYELNISATKNVSVGYDAFFDMTPCVFICKNRARGICIHHSEWQKLVDKSDVLENYFNNQDYTNDNNTFEFFVGDIRVCNESFNGTPILSLAQTHEVSGNETTVYLGKSSWKMLYACFDSIRFDLRSLLEQLEFARSYRDAYYLVIFNEVKNNCPGCRGTGKVHFCKQPTMLKLQIDEVAKKHDFSTMQPEKVGPLNLEKFVLELKLKFTDIIVDIMRNLSV